MSNEMFMSEDEMVTIGKAVLGKLRMRYPRYRKYLEGVQFKASGSTVSQMTLEAAMADHTSGKVYLNPMILGHPLNEGCIDETVLHELAHIIANRLSTANVNHSVIWRSVYKKIGGVDGKTHNFVVPTELQEKWEANLTEVPCPKCEKKMKLDPRRAMKMAMGVCLYVCGKCKS